MDTFVYFFGAHPFLFGLGTGLTVALFFWLRLVYAEYSHGRRVETLKGMLGTKMEVEARGQGALKEEMEKLRKQNENLRITVQTLRQKPGRAEVRQLHVYDAAVRSLLSRSPGFGPAWETVLKEAEAELAETETGVKAFVRRVFSLQPSRRLPAETGEENTSLRNPDEEDI